MVQAGVSRKFAGHAVRPAAASGVFEMITRGVNSIYVIETL